MLRCGEGELSELVFKSFHLSVGAGDWLWARAAKHGPYQLSHLPDSARVLVMERVEAAVWPWFGAACFSLLKKSLVTLHDRQNKENAVFHPVADDLFPMQFPCLELFPISSTDPFLRLLGEWKA